MGGICVQRHALNVKPRYKNRNRYMESRKRDNNKRVFYDYAEARPFTFVLK